MTLKKCSGCGARFDGDMKFCANCGGKLVDLDTNATENNEADSSEVLHSSDSGTEKIILPVNNEIKPEGKQTGRVIRLDAKTVTLGMADGTVREVPHTNLGFKASINDEIEIFTSNGQTIYAKAVSNGPTIVVQTDKKANKLIYFLLAFFLGATGIHNLYSGNTAVGIIWLIVFGICLLLNLTGIGAVIGLPAIIVLEVIALIQAIVYVLR